MKTKIRQWLRALIGWDELDARIGVLCGRMTAMGEQEAKLNRQNKRDRTGAPLAVTDWETAQAAWLSDPKNFEQGKEN